MYAVGGPHQLRKPAREGFRQHLAQGSALATSAEVLQELLHAYLPVGRTQTLDAALLLARDLTTIWPIDAEDVHAARDLNVGHPALSARDLLHLAVCVRRSAIQLWSFDQALIAAWNR